MAKNKEIVAGAQSKWDGSVAGLLGTGLLALLVITIFAGAGVGVAFALGVFNENPETLMLVVSIAVLALLTLIGLCWASIIGLKYVAKHSVVNGQRMKLTANTWNLFWNAIKWLIFIAITIGIYLLWLPVAILKWLFAHMVSVPEVDDYGYAQPEISYYEDDYDYDY